MKNLTLQKLITDFLKWSEVTLKPATTHAYRHHLTRFLRLVKNKRVSNLRPMHLTRVQRCWHDWQAVQRLFRWAIDEAAYVKKNPFAKVKSPGRNERKRILGPRDLARFLRACRRTPRRFLLAMRELAARPQEVRTIRWGDLHAQNPAMSVDEALRANSAVFVLHDFKDRARRRDPAAPRVLLVTRRLGRLLLRLRRGRGTPVGPVLLNSRSRPWTTNAVRCLMRRLRKRLGYGPDERGERVVAYTIRHSMATAASANGMLDRPLADWLGHVETRTTRRYQHLCVDHIRQALERAGLDRPGGDRLD